MKMIDNDEQTLPAHERGTNDGDIIDGHSDLILVGGIDSTQDTSQEHSVQVERDRYRSEISSLSTSYSLAQKEISLLNMELARARHAIEEQSIQATRAMEQERLHHEEEIKKVKDDSIRMYQECQKHMIDPKMKALFLKYTRLSNPSKGVTFARYLCPGPGYKDFFCLQNRRKSTKCSSVLNELRLQGRAKILYARHQSLLDKHRDVCGEVIRLKKLLRKKYQSEFDSIRKQFESYNTTINLLVETLERLEDEKNTLSLKLSKEVTHGKQQDRLIEDLKISERLITNKYRNIKIQTEEQNSKDMELKMFLQSCLYAMKKSTIESQSCMETATLLDQGIQTLVEKVQIACGGVDIYNLTPSDVHAFISLLVRRMNSS